MPVFLLTGEADIAMYWGVMNRTRMFARQSPRVNMNDVVWKLELETNFRESWRSPLLGLWTYIFQPGEGPISGLLRYCENFAKPSFPALLKIFSSEQMFSLTKCHLLLEEQSHNLRSTYLETKAGPGVRAGSWQRTRCPGPRTSDTPAPATLKHNGHQLQASCIL